MRLLEKENPRAVQEGVDAVHLLKKFDQNFRPIENN